MKARLFVALAVLFLAAVPGSRPELGSGGDFEGIVRDATGGVLPGATLVLTNVETGVERTSGRRTTTGRYRIPAVPAGAYTLDGVARRLRHRAASGPDARGGPGADGGHHPAAGRRDARK